MAEKRFKMMVMREIFRSDSKYKTRVNSVPCTCSLQQNNGSPMATVLTDFCWAGLGSRVSAAVTGFL